MLRAVIIDDEQRGINTLKLLIEMFVPDIKVVAETTEAKDGIRLIDDYRPEIVFLDIQMPFLNGFEVLERISFRNFHLIFTTAHEEYALQAIKNNVLDYLLKPVVGEQLKQAIEKVSKKIEEKRVPDLSLVVAELNKTTKTRLPITDKDGTIFVLLDDIIRLEADSNYTKVILKNGNTGLNSKTLKEYENLLCQKESSFMRISQSHIVNLKHVIKYLKEDGGVVITRDNQKLSLSKSKKDEFIKWLDVH